MGHRGRGTPEEAGETDVARGLRRDIGFGIGSEVTHLNAERAPIVSVLSKPSPESDDRGDSQGEDVGYTGRLFWGIVHHAAARSIIVPASSALHSGLGLALALSVLLAAMAGQAAEPTIATVAGVGTGFHGGFSGDGGPATSAQLGGPDALVLDASGNLYLADAENNRIRKVDARTGIITTVAGNGTAEFGGDGGPATEAQIDWPFGLAVDSTGSLFIADFENGRVRKVDVRTGTSTTVAGNGTIGGGGDGGPAASAQLLGPASLAVDASGNLYIADSANQRIRRVAARTGIITTVAGDGAGEFGGDGGPATDAQLNQPTGLAFDASGNLFIADAFNHRIRRVDARTGIITTVAGDGTSEFGGDGGPATDAQLNHPVGVAVDADGNLFIADQLNHRIRQVAAGTGIITTVAGSETGVFGGFGGDGGAAASAQLRYPSAVILDPSGNLLVADTGNDRVRTIAGLAAGTRPLLAAPVERRQLALTGGTQLTLAWTLVPGAAAYGLEYTGPGGQFPNPSGDPSGPLDPAGNFPAGLVVPGTSLTTTLPPLTPAGTYLIRVIGLSPTGQFLGRFSDALVLIVE